VPGKKQIPQANPALGMTVLEFFRSLLGVVAAKYKPVLPFGTISFLIAILNSAFDPSRYTERRDGETLNAGITVAPKYTVPRYYCLYTHYPVRSTPILQRATPAGNVRGSENFDLVGEAPNECNLQTPHYPMRGGE
jgi:hypothetical protein